MTEDLIKAHEECKKLMPILHLPVQSGSSKILKLMNRKHNVEEYLSILRKLKEKKPNIQFSSDFIIGYPGETESDFNNTLTLMKDVKFINSYSFVYSARPGTPAANLETVDRKKSKDRLKIFQETADIIKKDYRKNILNTKVNVLFENRLDGNKYFGRDEYSNSVVVENKNNIVGNILDVKITKFNYNTLFGEVINNEKDVAA